MTPKEEAIRILDNYLNLEYNVDPIHSCKLKAHRIFIDEGELFWRLVQSDEKDIYKEEGNIGGVGGGSMSIPQAASVNPLDALNAASEDQEQENVVTLGQSSSSTGGSIRAYVVSDEMTTQQEADAKINDLARL